MNSEPEDGVLILGVGGQLGRELYRVYPRAITISHYPEAEDFLDVRNEDKVKEFISRHRPSLVINAAAMTNVDRCQADHQLAYETNTMYLKYIAKEAQQCDSTLVKVSTDYVFDGARGKYTESDIPSPINYYGLSKLVGDTFAQICDNHLIVRTSGVYGHSKNFPYYVYSQLRSHQPIQVFGSYYSPIHARNLAIGIKAACDLELRGILNVAGDRISRYDLANSICSEFGI